MLRYQKGYIFEGQSFVVNKADIHNAKDEQFVEATALLPDGWVSIEDRLPERDERILVYRPCSEHSDTGPVSVQCGWICNKKIPEVSHWMPLPEPPKEVDHETD